MVRMPNLISCHAALDFALSTLCVGDWDTESLIAIGGHTTSQWLSSNSDPGLLDSRVWFLTSSLYHTNIYTQAWLWRQFQDMTNPQRTWEASFPSTRDITPYPPQRSHSSVEDRHAPWWLVLWKGSWKHRRGSSNTTRNVEKNIPEGTNVIKSWVFKREVGKGIPGRWNSGGKNGRGQKEYDMSEDSAQLREETAKGGEHESLGRGRWQAEMSGSVAVRMLLTASNRNSN